MGKLIVCRANEIIPILYSRPIAAVLSIEHPDAYKRLDSGFAPRLEKMEIPGAPVQKILSFYDTEKPMQGGPDEKQVEEGVRFALEQLEKGDVIIHCRAGKSRSTAVALGVLALQNPKKSEKELIRMLLEIRPIAAPNILIVEMIDRLAGRGGRLLRAVKRDKGISFRRAAAEAARETFIKLHPDLAKKMMPERVFPQKKPRR